jgi:hypothetical protein
MIINLLCFTFYLSMQNYPWFSKCGGLYNTNPTLTGGISQKITYFSRKNIFIFAAF